MTPAEMHPTRRQMDELLTGIRAIALPLDELANAGRRGLEHLQRRGQLYIDARALPADPQLVHAQTTGRYMPLPANAKQLNDLWRDIAEGSGELTTGLATSTGLAGEHPRQAAALARTTPPESTDHTVAGSAARTDPAPVGEVTNIESARRALRTIAATAEQAVTAIDGLTESLMEADLDMATLSETWPIIEAAKHLATTAQRALSVMNARHATLEEAANATPRPAAISFYRRMR